MAYIPAYLDHLEENEFETVSGELEQCFVEFPFDPNLDYILAKSKIDSKKTYFIFKYTLKFVKIDDRFLDKNIEIVKDLTINETLFIKIIRFLKSFIKKD